MRQPIDRAAEDWASQANNAEPASGKMVKTTLWLPPRLKEALELRAGELMKDRGELTREYCLRGLLGDGVKP